MKFTKQRLKKIIMEELEEVQAGQMVRVFGDDDDGVAAVDDARFR